MKRLAHFLLHDVGLIVVTGLFVFWAGQVLAWPLIMVFAIFDPAPFTNSLLFTVEISLWALELTAGVGAVGAWALLHAKHNTTKGVNPNGRT